MDDEGKQRGLENFLVLVLGARTPKISVLHLEKEVFLLWNFHPNIKEYLRFIRHYHGPFSREIQETIHKPLFSEGFWRYTPPERDDDISSGFVSLTDQGKKRYDELVSRMVGDGDMDTLLSGIMMVRELYDRLSDKELLLLVYDTYPEYIEKSSIYRRIFKEKRQLAESMLSKGVIDEERYHSLIEGNCHA